jgi:hypothetical protein
MFSFLLGTAILQFHISRKRTHQLRYNPVIKKQWEEDMIHIKKLFLTVIADNTVHIGQVTGEWIHNICNIIKMTTDKGRPRKKYSLPHCIQ